MSNATTTRRVACPGYAARRDSELNLRGHEIQKAATHLLELLDALKDSYASEELITQLRKLGIPWPDANGRSSLGCLAQFEDDCRGFHWSLKNFTEGLYCNLLPTPEELEQMKDELLAEHGVVLKSTDRSRRKAR